jgi:hypothetical protein
MWTFPDITSPETAERPRVEPGVSGKWLYEGTDIPAVGARTITLGEEVNPLVLAREGGTPVAVQLSLAEIEADARLNWALQVGEKLEVDGERRYEVPWSVWEEYASAPASAWLPEHDGIGVERSLAASERQVRFAKQALDEAVSHRNKVVMLASSLGLGRREVGEFTDLSTARIQQLLEDPRGELARDVEEFELLAAAVVAEIGTETVPLELLPRPPQIGPDQMQQVTRAMVALGLLEEGLGLVRVSDDGLMLRVGTASNRAKRRAARVNRNRERAGNAAE